MSRIPPALPAGFSAPTLPERIRSGSLLPIPADPAVGFYAMFVIRDAVWADLAEAARADFMVRMRAHLKEFFPERLARASTEQITRFIERQISRAEQYGIITEIEVARYIDLAIVLGPDFDTGYRHPWAKEILNRRELSAEQKLRALLDSFAGGVPGSV